MDVRLLGGKDHTPAIVDGDGHLHTNSIMCSQISDASWGGDAFRILAEIDMVDTTMNPMFWLRNDRTGKDKGRRQRMLIDRLIISSDANIHAEVWLNTPYTSGGSAAALHPLNRGEATSADATAKDAATALVLDQTGAVEIQSVFIGAYRPYIEDMSGRLILPKGDTFAVYAQGAAGNKVRLELDFYWAPEPM